jgi:hypothetical protein
MARKRTIWYVFSAKPVPTNSLGDEAMPRPVADIFMDQFDEDGRYTEAAPSVPVVFLKGDQQFSGALHFNKGLCLRATMDDGEDWAYPDNSPLHMVRFLLHFEGEPPHGVLIHDGRVVAHYEQGHPQS